jgi:hypothetical protein
MSLWCVLSTSPEVLARYFSEANRLIVRQLAITGIVKVPPRLYQKPPRLDWLHLDALSVLACGEALDRAKVPVVTDRERQEAFTRQTRVTSDRSAPLLWEAQPACCQAAGNRATGRSNPGT